MTIEKLKHNIEVVHIVWRVTHRVEIVEIISYNITTLSTANLLIDRSQEKEKNQEKDRGKSPSKLPRENSEKAKKKALKMKIISTLKLQSFFNIPLHQIMSVDHRCIRAVSTIS